MNCAACSVGARRDTISPSSPCNCTSQPAPTASSLRIAHQIWRASFRNRQTSRVDARDYSDRCGRLPGSWQAGQGMPGASHASCRTSSHGWTSHTKRASRQRAHVIGHRGITRPDQTDRRWRHPCGESGPGSLGEPARLFPGTSPLGAGAGQFGPRQQDDFLSRPLAQYSRRSPRDPIGGGNVERRSPHSGNAAGNSEFQRSAKMSQR